MWGDAVDLPASQRIDLWPRWLYFQQGNHLYRIERIAPAGREPSRVAWLTIKRASLVIVDKIGGQEVKSTGDQNQKEVVTRWLWILGLCRAVQTIILLPQNDFSRFERRFQDQDSSGRKSLEQVFLSHVKLGRRLRQSNKDMEKRQAQLDSQSGLVWGGVSCLSPNTGLWKLAHSRRPFGTTSKNLKEQKSILKDAHEDLANKRACKLLKMCGKDFPSGASQERYRLEIEGKGAQEQAEAKSHLEELQSAQRVTRTISNLKQYQKQLLQVEQDLEIAQEELKAQEQAFGEVRLKKRRLQLNLRIFFKRNWKRGRNIIYAQSLAQEAGKIKQSVLTSQEVRRNLSVTSKRDWASFPVMSDLEATNRLSLESLHEAEKLLQIWATVWISSWLKDLKKWRSGVGKRPKAS